VLNLDDFHFQKRLFVTLILDAADYRVGYIFSMPFVKILKVKTSTIMESPKYLTIIKIFNREYVKV
jgi:hypothetical protein